jgi:hypothetical protein
MMFVSFVDVSDCSTIDFCFTDKTDAGLGFVLVILLDFWISELIRHILVLCWFYDIENFAGKNRY